MAPRAPKKLAAAISASLVLLPQALTPLGSLVLPSGSTASVPATSVLRPGSVDDERAVGFAVGAGEGIAIAMEQVDDGSSVLEQLARGSAPRVIRRFDGGAATPTVGTDARGRTVAVVRGCAPRSEEDRTRGRCALSVVDVATGKTRPLPHSTGAALADMDRGQAVVVASSDQGVPRLSRVADRSTAAPQPVTPLAAPIARYATSRLGAGGQAFQIDAIDGRAGSIALVGETASSSGSASLLLRTDATVDGGAWRVLAASTYGDGGFGDRNFVGPQLAGSGTRAYFDGAGVAHSYAGLWSAAGELVQQAPGVRYGNPRNIETAGFAGDTLYAAIGFLCGDGEEENSDCGVLAGGPVPLTAP